MIKYTILLQLGWMLNLLISKCCISCDNSTNVYLTTAKIEEFRLPKPTVHLEIGVDSDANASVSSIDQPTRRKKTDRKLNTALKWDEWCQLQSYYGSCVKNITRYKYNREIDICETFTYSGCGGNKNNFATKNHCEHYCKGAGFMVLMADLDASQLCFLQPDTGVCVGMYEKYYFDMNEQTCKKFIYAGCGGNDNRFSSYHECMEACGDS